MSFSETVFLFVLALIVFGPKKLPEMARQAGRILAELRRASNEFKSQIESEIAHIEVQKNLEAAQQSPPPPGSVASLSLNPASSETIPHNPAPAATLAAPAVAVNPAAQQAAGAISPEASSTSSEPTPVAPDAAYASSEANHSAVIGADSAVASTPEPVVEVGDSASQASHV